MAKNKKDTLDFSPVSLLRSVAIYGGIGIFISFILTLLFAYLLSAKDMSSNMPDIFSIISLALGGFTGGFFISKKIKKRGAILGLFAGLFIFIITIIAGLFFNTFSFSIFGLIKNIILLIASVVGGIMGVNIKKKEKI
jgi:putative membrane protein (TIGR04086 family)